MFNWKFFCYGGLAVSVVLGAIDYFSGNTSGAQFQLVVVLAYATGITYLSLKQKKT